MTVKGEELFAALKGVRDFLGDLGQLLVAGDVLMAEHSWEAVGDTTSVHGLSYSLYQGRQWMPRSAFRRYTNKAEYPLVVGMISLLLDEENFKLTEPVISGTYFGFADGTPLEKVWVEPWNSLWAGWRGAPLDASPIGFDDSDPHWKKTWGFKVMRTVAVPLVEVENQTALKERVINPLLNMIADSQSSLSQ